MFQFAARGVLPPMPHAACLPMSIPDVRGTPSASDDEPPPAAEIDIRLADGLGHPIDPRWIAQRLQQAATAITEAESVVVQAISVFVVDDARMIELHDRHAGIAGTTDVLTFDLRHDGTGPIRAELVVCADEAARRAHEHGLGIDRELLLYCIHGMLHCAGHNDDHEEGWRRMHAREDEILRAIGVGPVFEALPDEGGGGAPP
jgi:probable rRNA maturation factor